jgi:hypothetical protein
MGITASASSASAAFGRDRVAQAKLGHVVAHRFAPVEPALMMQQRQGRKSSAFSWCKPTILTANSTAISRMRSCRR